jgi:hypothetical protein
MKLLRVNLMAVLMFFVVLTSGFADTNTLLSAVGGPASDVYMKYAAIGSIGDGFEKGVYDSNFVKTVVGDILTLNNSATEHFNNMLNSGDFVGEDVVFGNRMIETYKYLSKEAEAFANYLMTMDKKYADEFQVYRKLAWGTIKLLLGLK